MPLSEEHRAAISRGQAERHRRLREAEALAAPIDQKPCSKCGEWKRIPEDYSMAKRKLADGSIRIYPPGECKDCTRKRADTWKTNFIAENGIEAWNAQWKKWNANRDAAAKRRYDRDYQRMMRAEAGIPTRGPWRKYRGEAPGAPEAGPKVDTTPFREWWDSLPPETKERAYAVDENIYRRIYRIFHEQRQVELAALDGIATLAGYPGVAHSLYPDHVDHVVASAGVHRPDEAA